MQFKAVAIYSASEPAIRAYYTHNTHIAILRTAYIAIHTLYMHIHMVDMHMTQTHTLNKYTSTKYVQLRMYNIVHVKS